MGSKVAMLRNGLGETLLKEATHSARIADLFCGSASVSWFAAQRLGKPVIATDLQHFAVVIAGAVVERIRPISASALVARWFASVDCARRASQFWRAAQRIDASQKNALHWSRRARELCALHVSCLGPVWNAYGGHYFSPTQALTLDAMLATLPKRQDEKAVCLAACVISASQCAAAPGHTAQPFQPTITAGRFLREAWLRNPLQYAEQAVNSICSKYALRKGRAEVADANCAAAQLRQGDLAFIDPPYSGVHYSRFYHVLETIAVQGCGQVSGIGRYPPREERPWSRYSVKSEAHEAISELLRVLARVGCNVLLTFPAGECSNGLSGSLIERAAELHFRIKKKKLVSGRFSTLGGNNHKRNARNSTVEMILMLRPR